MNRFLTLAIIAMLAGGCSHDHKPLRLDNEGEARQDASAFTFSNPRGFVVTVETGDADWDSACNDHLHFCIFENGESDLMYVGTKYGLWMNADFDLTFNGNVVFTGGFDRLLYSGRLVDIGNAVPPEFDPEEDFDLNGSKVYSSRLKGQLK